MVGGAGWFINFSKLIEQTRSEEFHGMMHRVYETQDSALRLVQTLLLNTHHYERNFEYNIEEANRKSLVVSIEPKEHMAGLAYHDEVLGDFLCRYKKSYFSKFPEYIGEKGLKISEKECHFHGARKCIYKLSAA